MNIVLIGAGSRSFGRGQVVDVLLSEDMEGASLRLVDENEAALDIMTRFAHRVRDHVGADVNISAHTEREDALSGADAVITAVERKRMELWEQDFRIPMAYGFRHVLGENGGPGALFHALRTIDLVVPIARDIERICPDAWLFNFTNPEMRVLHAVSHLTSTKAAGFCHGVFSAIDALAKYTGRDASDLNITSAGINHFYAILQCRDRETGQDLLPQAVERAAHDESAFPVFRTFARVFGVFTFPSDDHIGEYLSWGHTYESGAWPYGAEARPVASGSLEFHDSLEPVADGVVDIPDHLLRESGESTVPVLASMRRGRPARFPAVNTVNSAGYITNLPASAVVEVPATVDGDGIHPECVGALPEPFAAFVRTQTTIAETITEAYRTRSRSLLLQTLLLDPVVNDAVKAERMLDHMLSLQKEWLPEFD